MQAQTANVHCLESGWLFTFREDLMCSNVKFTACRVFFLLAINPRNAKRKTVSSSPARHFYCITLHFSTARFLLLCEIRSIAMRIRATTKHHTAPLCVSRCSGCESTPCLPWQLICFPYVLRRPHTAARLETTTNPSSSFWNIVPVLFAPHRCRLTPHRVWFRKTEAFTLIPLFRVEPLDLRHKHPLAFSHVFTRYNAFSLCSANTLLLLSCNPEKREMQEQKACKSLLVHRDPETKEGECDGAWCDEQRTDRRRSQLKIVWNNVSKLIEFRTR